MNDLFSSFAAFDEWPFDFDSCCCFFSSDSGFVGPLSCGLLDFSIDKSFCCAFTLTELFDGLPLKLLFWGVWLVIGTFRFSGWLSAVAAVRAAGGLAFLLLITETDDLAGSAVWLYFEMKPAVRSSVLFEIQFGGQMFLISLLKKLVMLSSSDLPLMPSRFTRTRFEFRIFLSRSRILSLNLKPRSSGLSPTSRPFRLSTSHCRTVV